MKKVIKPSKQPTKKQSQRRQQNTNTAKLKKAIGKIAAQLVKDHPKLVKGGGSSGITDLIFSKNLMKGGEINDKLRGDIETFLKVSAPKVNKLKKELIIKLIEYFITTKETVPDLHVGIKNLHDDFKKGVYDYKDDKYEKFLEKIESDDFIILEIVKKFYILSRINESDIPEEISNVNFEKLPNGIITELEKYKQDGEEENREEVKKNIKGLLEKYKSDKGENVKEDGKVLVAAKVEVEKNIEFELNIRIDAAIQAAIAANNEIEEIKNALDKKTAADTDASAAEAVTSAATAALTKVTTAAAEAVEKTDTKATAAAAEAVEKADTKAAVEEAGKDAVIAAIAALSAIYAKNNDGIDEINDVAVVEEKKEGKDEISLVVNKSPKDNPAYFLAVNEIIKIMKIKPSSEQDKKALNVVLNQRIQGESIDKTLARAAATVAADYVKEAKEEEKSTAIIYLIDNRRYGGGKPAPKYKSTGQVVNIMYKKRKYKRTIFVKEKRKTKYCKINNEYILLSKLNVL